MMCMTSCFQILSRIYIVRAKNASAMCCFEANVLQKIAKWFYSVMLLKVSMVRDIRDREIRIYTDAGRVCRPLLIVENQKLALKKKHIDQLKDSSNNYSWSELVAGGVVELIDAMEEGLFCFFFL